MTVVASVGERQRTVFDGKSVEFHDEHGLLKIDVQCSRTGKSARVTFVEKIAESDTRKLPTRRLTRRSPIAIHEYRGVTATAALSTD